MHIGNRLKKIRSLKGLSQVSVCKGIVSPSHYSNIESGRYEASEDILELIAERLAVPSNYLTGIHKDSLETDEVLIALNEMLNEEDGKEAIQFLQEKTKELQYIPSIQQEIRYLLSVCQVYIKERDVEEAKNYYRQLSFYVNGENISTLPSDCIYKYYYVSALMSYYERDFQSSSHLYETALNYTDSEEERGRILFNLALIFFSTNQIQKGLYHALDAKNIYLNLHKWRNTVDTYVLIGILYIELKEFSKGKDTLEKGLNLATEQEMLPAQARILHNLGVIHYKQKDFKASYENFQKKPTIKVRGRP
ncbi:MAG: helix-turn-helix domain-containing protein [Bacillus sp. (in: Bacteria)]|nr:helix-turn-helix domain-containing protein [Bacillus sp. (in: firmicutes)]